jgi:hypothetical protein
MTDYEKAPLGAYSTLALLLDGLVEALPYEKGLSRLEAYLPEILETLKSQAVYMDLPIAQLVTDILEVLTTKLKARRDELGSLQALESLVPLILEIALTTQGILLAEKTDRAQVSASFAVLLLDLSDIVGGIRYAEAYEELLRQLTDSSVETWSSYEIKVVCR